MLTASFLRRRGAAAVTLGLAAALLTTPAGPPAAAAATDRQISYTPWATKSQFHTGTLVGLRVARGRLRLDSPTRSGRYVDPHGGPTKTYSYGTWTSPWRSPGFGLTELIPSWEATAGGDAWVMIKVRGRTAAGKRSSWDVIARWSPGDRTFHRTSDSSQRDDLAWVATDTFRADPGVRFTSYQVRATLFGRKGTTATPFLDAVGAMASRLPSVTGVRTSRPGVARGVTLDVPRYSQMIHSGHYRQWGGGGQAWCSPTSTSMVLGYYDALPSATEYAWVPRRHPNRYVDHAARMTYDYAYGGNGNWPFNTAYAAQYVKHAFVTRLRDLREAERFIRNGIPVVASISFGRGDLDGAPISSTNGHLVVIVGFTNSGDVVVNDPAASRNSGVRRTYDRGQFEDAWVPRSGGLAYIVHTGKQALPARNGNQNW